MMHDIQIVDADAHVNPPHSFWADYLPEHLRQFAPVIEHADDADYILFEGTRRKVNLLGAAGGVKKEEMKNEGRVEETVKKGGSEAIERLADMDRDGMDAAVLFGGGPLGSANEELFIASFDAYNRWLADYCSHGPDRLCGVAYLPMQDVSVAVTKLREAARMGYTAVNIPAFPHAPSKAGIGGFAAQARALTGDADSERRYCDAEFDPFWAAACDLGMTITIHLGARVPRFGIPQYFLPDMPMSKVAMAEPIAIMLFGAVFQRFPDLRFVSVESGVGWFAWFTEYMDQTWKKQRFWTKSPLKEPPSFYMDQNVYGSFINDRIGIALRHQPGGRNIMWSSDYPHSETTFPHSLELIKHDFADVSEEDRRLILGERCKKLFRVGDGRVRPLEQAAA